MAPSSSPMRCGGCSAAAIGRCDPQFTGLATPARVALTVIVFALIMAGLLWLLSIAVSP